MAATRFAPAILRTNPRVGMRDWPPPAAIGSGAHSPSLAVQLAAEPNRRGPVGLNPRPAGSPVLRVASPGARLCCARAAAAAFAALPSSQPLAGRKSASSFSAGLKGVDTATPSVHRTASANRRTHHQPERRQTCPKWQSARRTSEFPLARSLRPTCVCAEPRTSTSACTTPTPTPPG